LDETLCTIFVLIEIYVIDEMMKDGLLPKIAWKCCSPHVHVMFMLTDARRFLFISDLISRL